jgi:uncharacterized protein with von Willebrand factor type A (vWA) domain
MSLATSPLLNRPLRTLAEHVAELHAAYQRAAIDRFCLQCKDRWTRDDYRAAREMADEMSEIARKLHLLDAELPRTAGPPAEGKAA